jgi:hypothetical protein
MAIAEYHNVRYGTANIDLATLCDDILMDRRNLRRMLGSLSAFIDYLPGRGRGNYGQFRFVHLIDDKGGSKGGNKRVISASAVKEENLNLDQNQVPPTPLFSKGGRDSPKVTRRDIRRINELVTVLMRDCCSASAADHFKAEHSFGWVSHDYRPGLDPETALASACAKVCVPIEIARGALWAAGLEIGTKKEPQRATA